MSELKEWRLLLIEDNPVDRALQRKFLEELGFVQIDEAQDGSEARFKIQNSVTLRSNYDLVILDWKMPMMNGIGILKLIRNHPKTENIPVIMLTGVNDEDHVREALAAGASDYIIKPVAYETLKEKIDKVVKRLGR